MDEVAKLSGPSTPAASGGKPRRLIVFLHGFGADGNDLIGLAPYFADVVPDADFLSPHAPYPCVMAGFGRQWFNVYEQNAEGRLAAIRVAAGILDRFLDDELKARGLTDAELALIGFSQGTMMSLFVAPRRARACAGVIGYSGTARIARASGQGSAFEAAGAAGARRSRRSAAGRAARSRDGHAHGFRLQRRAPSASRSRPFDRRGGHPTGPRLPDARLRGGHCLSLSNIVASAREPGRRLSCSRSERRFPAP